MPTQHQWTLTLSKLLIILPNLHITRSDCDKIKELTGVLIYVGILLCFQYQPWSASMDWHSHRTYGGSVLDQESG